MADIRRIVTLNTAGTPTTIVDLEDQTVLNTVRDSWKVEAAQRTQILAQDQRRYGGGRVAHETHANANVSWDALVTGATADAALTSLEALLAVLEDPRGMFYEWRPDGATSSVFYEVRGPATYTVNYRQIQFAGAQSLIATISVPVGPLARRAPATQTITPASALNPAVFSLTTIGGRAPALCDAGIQVPTATAPKQAAFALIAWWSPRSAPATGTVGPFGIIEGDAANVTRSNASVVTQSDARGGSLARLDAGSRSANLSWMIDPSIVPADAFGDTVDIEVWGHFRIPAASTPTPTAKVYAAGFNPGSGNERIFTQEFGDVDRPLVRPTTGTAYRLSRLGVITLPTRPAGIPWQITVKMTSGAVGEPIDCDFLLTVPARQRAASPSGKTITGVAPSFNSRYPFFLPGGSTTASVKTILSDLSGRIAALSAPADRYATTGLGGARIELAPGAVDMLVYLSRLAPDDPVATSNDGLDTYTLPTIEATVTPRYWVASG